jgi:hypothetical protein
VQLLLGRRTALGLGGAGHRRIDGGHDRTALVAAVGLLLRAARAVLPRVEQHPVIAPHVAALLTLWQGRPLRVTLEIGDRVAQAEQFVRDRRGDVVIEAAPGSADELFDSALPFFQAGYAVELVVLGAVGWVAARWAHPGRPVSRPG